MSTDSLTIRITASHATYGSFIRDFSVAKVKQGADGIVGKDGVGIKTTTITYANLLAVQ